MTVFITMALALLVDMLVVVFVVWRIFGGADGTVVVHVSLITVTRVPFWLRAVI